MPVEYGFVDRYGSIEETRIASLPSSGGGDISWLESFKIRPRRYCDNFRHQRGTKARGVKSRKRYHVSSSRKGERRDSCRYSGI